MKRVKLLILLISVLMVSGCSGKSEGAKQSNQTSELEQIQEPVATKEDENNTVADQEEALILPETDNTTGKVMIQTVSDSYAYPLNSYIITSANGEVVIVDPTQMPSKEVVDLNPAAIVNTHGHDDHVDKKFNDSYPESQTIKYVKDDINTKDFHIYTILSSHSGDTIEEANNNVIAVFEVDGLRIVHMGDIGQTALTEEQLEALGEVDVAFMQFENSYSDMTLKNEKGFKIIEQLNPKIVIPTHYTDKALPVLEEKYGAIQVFENKLTIAKNELPDTTLNVYQIQNEHKYK
ncbi:MBL fold metallo-hydrolase [Anaeromicropila populeti]|uniref:L-ascorbate metabolism protein UlaG, beta-lactamase superfamily n=1 Tax=Anaeromicropila populeti TaxID=37658 RepID=A0A1I6HJK2_9FIRM|nr:MBL fold metallo-hydrolase [Anaeromicropila populeti]SFR54588.1 L-ascorbate metabolism protein UlaG, beta-lactamase superfamily [Anaeromicropila populeti]